MVDALHAAHRAVRPGGTVIDLRPDSQHQPKVFQRRVFRGGLQETALAEGDSAASDRAIAQLIAQGLLRPVRTGHFWYSLRFPDRTGLDRWLETSRRLRGYAPGTRGRIDPRAGLVVRRSLTYGIYERVPS
ncbi:MAG TPA: hypothetical protein VM070_01675 [Candidatus Saccharimonadales bacterium]|nr:hypothetical protein [Candidatus Saccharimonadales bacterium]